MSKDVYQAPRAVDSVGFDDVEPNTQTFYHLKGRIGRLRYLAYQFLITIIFYLIVGIVMLVTGGGFDPESPTGFQMTGAVGIVIILLYIPLFVYGFAYIVRRLHDINQSGWLALLMLVPLVNLILMLVLTFRKGNPDDNKYGAPPRPNKWFHWVGGLAMPILLTIGILAAIAVPAYHDYLERAQTHQSQ